MCRKEHPSPCCVQLCSLTSLTAPEPQDVLQDKELRLCTVRTWLWECSIRAAEVDGKCDFNKKLYN